ncbi:DUF6216 family protein [Xanthomonas cannabis]|uniref:DUF6216 family protein n=1 Tax=Xanthomonas cannabis TaxID=1885674 RepID=UPI00141BC55C|nr:DUF6216 family protein [Xanthomonas cannabis]NIK00187.1 hypothetical protein [Xanthomonas cannabis]NIK63687.1 hypothetical protein [Xanthomonas cannabis]
MDWISIFTGNTFLLTAAGFFIAAIHICLRAGSLHPVNMRLLRLFIGKEDIEDQVIRRHLSDHAALTVFRMTYGIHVLTLADAKRLAETAEAQNVPLDLIGRVKDAFDIQNFKLKRNDPPGRGKAFVLAFCLVILSLGSVLFGAASFSEKLLVSLKSTGTWLWLSEDQAQASNPFIVGKRGILRVEDCKLPSDQRNRLISAPKGFDARDPEILCGIWQDSNLKKELARSVLEQKRAFVMAAAFLAWYAYMLFVLVNRRAAIVKLNSMLASTAMNPSSSEKRSRCGFKLILRVGRFFYWRIN